jgi:hypothetical protein
MSVTNAEPIWTSFSRVKVRHRDDLYHSRPCCGEFELANGFTFDRTFFRRHYRYFFPRAGSVVPIAYPLLDNRVWFRKTAADEVGTPIQKARTDDKRRLETSPRTDGILIYFLFFPLLSVPLPLKIAD